MKGSRSLLAIAIVLGVGLFGALAVQAQIPGEDWVRIAGLDISTRVIGISPTFSADGYVFAGTEGLGVWRSADGGATWAPSMMDPSLNPSPLAHSCVIDVAVSPNFANDQTLFAMTDDGSIYRCVDGQASPFTFSLVLAPPSGRSKGAALAIDPNFNWVASANLNVFAAFQTGGFYSSFDGGLTWQKDNASTEPDITIYDMCISPTFSCGGGDTAIYVGGTAYSGPVWIRTTCNVNGTWNSTTANPGVGDTEIVTTLLYTGSGRMWAGTLYHGMWRSTDTGGSWTAGCDGALGVFLPRVNAIARANNASPPMIEGRDDRPYRSTNSGVSCTAISPATTIWDVEFEPGYNGTTRCMTFFATPNGLLRKNCAAQIAKGPAKVDGRAVAIASNGYGRFMGSLSQGLYKWQPTSTNQYPMVRYNNFPNKKAPEITAVCLSPTYDMRGTCGTGAGTIFVAANFPTDLASNGVFRSSDFGATWTRLTGGAWNSGDYVYDLALSPASPTDGTLYAGCSTGVYRWDGGTVNWTKVRATTSPVWAVGLPPTYNKTGSTGFPYRTVFMGTDDGTYYQVWWSNDDGGTWTKTDWDSTGKQFGKPTSFTFQYSFGTTGTNQRVYASCATTTGAPAGAGGVIKCIGSSGQFSSGWTAYNTNLGTNPNVWCVDAEPQFGVSGYYDLLCATDTGTYRSAALNPSWTRKDVRPAWSVMHDPADTTGSIAMLGFQSNANSASLGGAAYVTDAKVGFTVTDFTGYGFLPDDVWSTVAHERDPNILFSASPSMGVFVSEDMGISFRPWNRGKGVGSGGPCVLTGGLGITMLKNRPDNNYDTVWVGTPCDGIKIRYIRYDASTGKVDLETEDGSTPNGWWDGHWDSTTGATITGRFERLEAVPGTAMTKPVWATSQATLSGGCSASTSAQGMAAQLPTMDRRVWILQNSGLGALTAKGVRQGDDGTDPVVLSSGAPVTSTVTSAAVQSGWKYYSIDVPYTAETLYCYMRDLNNDPDLYVRYGAVPTTTAWDYRPYLGGFQDESACVKALLMENFDEAWGAYGDNPPPGWVIWDGAGGSAWDTNDWYRAYWGGDYGAVAYISYSPVESQNDWLYSGTFDIPSGQSVVNLEFDHYFRVRSGSEYGRVYYTSTEHPSWTLLRQYTASTSGIVHDTISLLSYAGDTNARIGFAYVANNGYWWLLDNVQVYGINTASHATTLRPGTWYVGINGYPVGTSQYELTATVDGCAAAMESTPGTPRSTKSSDSTGESVPGPMAPSGNTTWGTVLNQGVYKGAGAPAESTPTYALTLWTACNGSPVSLTNLQANTVIQLTDGGLVVGCTGDVFWSPDPGSGQCTWHEATDNVANPGTNDFRDLLQCSNGDVLIAANGASGNGGVWLSGDDGGHWMKISTGFDTVKQNLEDLVSDGGEPVSYYTSTDSTGVYTRTITAYPYPVVTSVSPSNGAIEGGTEVTINGSNFLCECPEGVDCPDTGPMVLFGDDVDGVAVNTCSATQLTVTAPAHATGAVSVAVRNPDTRRSSSCPAFTYGCADPTVSVNNAAADLDAYAFSGVQVTWNSSPSAWHDEAGAGSRTYAVLRGGSAITSGIGYPSSSYTDTTGTAATTYSYQVRYSNKCTLTANTTGASAKDDAEAAGQAATALKWHGSAKIQLDWGTTTGADGYKLYRGSGSQLPNLPTNASVCLSYQGTALNTGATLTGEPSAGTFYWYLLAATKGGAEGTLGTGTGGTPEHVTSSGSCSPP
jgi:hypothetical protein